MLQWLKELALPTQGWKYPIREFINFKDIDTFSFLTEKYFQNTQGEYFMK